MYNTGTVGTGLSPSSVPRAVTWQHNAPVTETWQYAVFQQISSVMLSNRMLGASIGTGWRTNARPALDTQQSYLLQRTCHLFVLVYYFMLSFSCPRHKFPVGLKTDLEPTTPHTAGHPFLTAEVRIPFRAIHSGFVVNKLAVVHVYLAASCSSPERYHSPRPEALSFTPKGTLHKAVKLFNNQINKGNEPTFL